MSYIIGKADKKQIGAILEMMLNGISSDPTSVAALGGIWWRRAAFRYLVGPRMLTNQMTTFAAVQDDQVVGYLILQYEGETAGAFDWAVLNSLDEDGLDILGDLLEEALDHAEERGLTPVVYFGMQNDSDPRIAGLLVDLGFWLADYQVGQMRTTLPLAHSSPLPEGISVKPQISLRFGSRLAEFIRMDYDLPDSEETAAEEEVVESDTDEPDATEYQGLSLAARVEAISLLHESTLRASKIYLIEEEGEPVGFVQQFNWKEELRLLFALEPFLWGTETEKQLIAAMPEFVGKQDGHLRIRTFSSAHLSASRESFEALGLGWEEAPWQRWVVGL
ncbi:MAG: hypothetical protein KF753_23625 [Caldilineaceae bacterium]|nr:hypothetical protein [Caldilineaceae bacterium]